MDPSSLIVSAFVTILNIGTTEIIKCASKDFYDRFISLFSQKVKSNNDAKSALEALEQKPNSEGRQAILREELIKMDIDKETELIHLAQTLLEKLDQEGAQSGKYLINITNSQGTIIGDNNNVTQAFTNRVK